MSKVFIEEATLSSIGDAIREKTGTTEMIAPQDMGEFILSIEAGGSGDGDIPEEIRSDISYFNTYGHNDWLFKLGKPLKIINNVIGSTSGIASLCSNSQIEDMSHITFVINNRGFSSGVFQNCNKLKYLPNFYVGGGAASAQTTIDSFFASCYLLRDIPYDFFYKKREDGSVISNSWWDFGGAYFSKVFYQCYSLRSLPDLSDYDFMKGTSYSQTFNSCYALDEIRNIPVDINYQAQTGNKFSTTFNNCDRVKDITFNNDNGTPKVLRWNSQTIDLSSYVGYGSAIGHFTNYNSGLTTDTQITDDATYQALKNNPDSWTLDINYSRYNHDSAVNTINSLPDTSAYGTNIIKFKSASGALTDGGAINTLTEEEIAAATAKGWTVSLV